MTFNWLDYVVIALFFVALAAIPALASLKAKTKDTAEYFKSAGSMPWWLIGVSMVAATTSTNSANLFTEIVRRDGLSGNWVWWAFMLTGLLTVFIYSKLWVKSGATTDISFYELRYSGRPAAFLRAFRALYLGVIYNLVVMAVVLLGAIKIGVVMFGVSAWTILTVTAVASLVYSCLSGIRGTIYTDFFLFAVVMAGAFAVMVYGVNHPAVGGWSALMSNPAVLEKARFLPDFSNMDAAVAVFVIPVAVQWWNVWYPGSEPGGGGYIVQRVLTAKSPNHALGGTLFFNLLNYALRPWPWFIAAFASILIFPDLASIKAAFPGVDSALVGHDMAYPAMIKCVPNGWVGVVAASLMGALFSTIAAHLSMGANYVTNDVWKRFVRKDASDRELIFVARAASVVLMVAGCALAPLIESAKSGFDLMVQVGAGTGVIFLLRWFWMRINAWTEIVAMAVSFLCAVFFQIVWPHISDTTLLFWQKLLWTMAVTTVAWLTAMFATAPEKAETIAKFKALVRADGRDVGKGVLLMFLSAMALFGFMALVAKLIIGGNTTPNFPGEEIKISSAAGGRATVYSFGARLTDWEPASGGGEVFAMPKPYPKSWQEGQIHGGIPLCWPWFVFEGPEGCRIHGLTGYFPWKVKARASDRVTFELDDTPETRRLWPHKFHAELEYAFAGDALTATFRATNTGDAPFTCTEGFHPYFRVGDVAKCSVTGADGTRYFWKGEVEKGDRRVWKGDFPCALLAEGKPGYVFEEPSPDGVHVHSLIDPVLNRRIEVSYEGSIKFVTWNSGPDFSRFGGADDPEFGKKFVCVEGGTLYRDRAYTLNPGQTHELKMTVRVK